VITLVVDPQDYRRVYASDVHSQVWASFDEGATWRELTANLRELNPYAFGNTIEIYSTSPSTKEDVLLLGMLGGVFQMVHPDSLGAKWTLLGDGLPHTPAFDIHYDYTDNVLVAGTLGRGEWTLSKPFAADAPMPAAGAAVAPRASGGTTLGASVSLDPTLFLPSTVGPAPAMATTEMTMASLRFAALGAGEMTLSAVAPQVPAAPSLFDARDRVFAAALPTPADIAPWDALALDVTSSLSTTTMLGLLRQPRKRR
jgi:hypothetical protein